MEEQKNKVFREWLAKEHPGAILLEPGSFDGGIIGIKDGRVVYGEEKPSKLEFRSDCPGLKQRAA